MIRLLLDAQRVCYCLFYLCATKSILLVPYSTALRVDDQYPQLHTQGETDVKEFKNADKGWVMSQLQERREFRPPTSFVAVVFCIPNSSDHNR